MVMKFIKSLLRYIVVVIIIGAILLLVTGIFKLFTGRKGR